MPNYRVNQLDRQRRNSGNTEVGKPLKVPLNRLSIFSY